MRARSRNGTRSVGAVAALALLAGACAPDAPDDAGADDDDGDVVADAEDPDDADDDTEEPDEVDDAEETAEAAGDDEIVVVTAEDPPTLEAPYGYSATTGVVLRNIQEPLVGRDRESGEFVGLLATDWEAVDDTTWRFELREGIDFHDGSPFNAEAAAHALNISWSEDFVDGPLLGFKGPDFEAVAVDEYTLDVELESPDPILPNRLWMSPIFSQEHFEQEGEDAWREEPIGTGPYEFVSWDRGQSIEIELNDDWWGHDDPEAAGGEATIERATYLIRGDQQSRVAAVQAGEAHLAERLPADQCLNDLGDACLDAPNIDIAHIRIDTMNPLLSDIRIREAMAVAIDREAIGDELLPGPPARMLVPDGATGYNEDIPIFDFDPDRARELVEEAEADGAPVDQTINLRVEREKFPGINEVAQAIQAMWQDVGLTVDFEVVDSALFLEELIDPPRPIDEDRGWVVLHQHSNRLADFHGTATSWYQCEAPISTWCDEEFDALTDEAGGLTGDERHELLAEAAMVAHEDIPFIPVVEMGLFHGVSDDLDWETRADTNVYLKDMSL